MTDWLDGMRLRLALVPRGLWVWLAWGAVGGGYELVTWASGHDDLTLSAQVWWLVWAGPDWANVAGAVIFGAIAGILGLHFFGGER